MTVVSHISSSSSLGPYGVLMPGLSIVVHKSSALLSALLCCELSFVRGDDLETADPHSVVRL